ncbi:MAG TPA: hypothetical protein VJJ82_05500 [Candidatus Nanoarchaeia archaeon]|nr:hypothetical protein [Candidatus Nanoarchaeia archaeon]
MKEVVLLLILMACTQVVETATPAAMVVSAPCEKRSVGEACGCGCLAPAQCVRGTCLLNSLYDGQGCVENGQCSNGSCIDGRCKHADSPAGVFDCKRVCNTIDRTGCATSCGFG